MSSLTDRELVSEYRYQSRRAAEAAYSSRRNFYQSRVDEIAKEAAQRGIMLPNLEGN